MVKNTVIQGQNNDNPAIINYNLYHKIKCGKKSD